jgi:Beta-lactamase
VARAGLSVASIEGTVSPGYEAVREAFADNFARRRELGAACCVYLRGEKVVDLWGGVRNRATREPWQRDTMVLVHSTAARRRSARPRDRHRPEHRVRGHRSLLRLANRFA